MSNENYKNELFSYYNLSEKDRENVMEIYENVDITKLKKKYFVGYKSNTFIFMGIAILIYIIIFIKLFIDGDLFEYDKENWLIILMGSFIFFLTFYLVSIFFRSKKYSINIYEPIRNGLSKYINIFFDNIFEGYKGPFDKPDNNQNVSELLIDNNTLSKITCFDVLSINSFEKTLRGTNFYIGRVFYKYISYDYEDKRKKEVIGGSDFLKLDKYRFPINNPVLICRDYGLLDVVNNIKKVGLSNMNFASKFMTYVLFFILFVVIPLVLFGIFSKPILDIIDLVHQKGFSDIEFATCMKLISNLLSFVFFIIIASFIFRKFKRSKKSINYKKELENKHFESKFEVFGEDEVDRRVVADPYIMQELHDKLKLFKIDFYFTKDSIIVFYNFQKIDGIYSDDGETRFRSILEVYVFWKNIKTIKHIFRNHKKI